MISLRRPSSEAIRVFLASQAMLGFTYTAVGATANMPPEGYAVDRTRIKLGLGESTTQQHWLSHSEDRFLVYTRKSEENAGVNRWRAPLYVARVDRRNLRLTRATERVVLPLIGDGIVDPKHVAGMGNFQTIAAAPGQSWVTAGEGFPGNGWRGNTLMARIHWGRPNRLCTSIRYTDTRKVEVGRMLLLNGWGIHRSLRGGWA